ncbi:MAG: Holliday junction branch migration DNA helicase RuvB [Bacteroidota bacterium]
MQSRLRKSDSTKPERNVEDGEVEQTLRPPFLRDFVGQEKMVNNLRIFIQAAKSRSESLEHVLFTGPPGLGKTTLAHIIAHEMGTTIKITSGPALDKPSNLAGILTSLQPGEVLFIDEIHRTPPAVEEFLYSAMEDFRLDIVIDQGPNARTVQLSLNKFTLVGATTRSGMLSAPLRARFGVTDRLDYYTPETLGSIVRRSASILGVEIDTSGVLELARRSRGTPRIANRLLRRCRDFAEADPALARFKGRITEEVADHALRALEVDTAGLDDMDKRILRYLIDTHHGGPSGLNTIAAAVGEDPGTIEEVYEPFLIQQGFLVRNSRGREVTSKAYSHFGITVSSRLRHDDTGGQMDLPIRES